MKKIELTNYRIQSMKNKLFWILLLSIPIVLTWINYLINKYILIEFYIRLSNILEILKVILIFVYAVLAVSYLYNKYIVIVNDPLERSV